MLPALAPNGPTKCIKQPEWAGSEQKRAVDRIAGIPYLSGAEGDVWPRCQEFASVPSSEVLRSEGVLLST